MQRRFQQGSGSHLYASQVRNPRYALLASGVPFHTREYGRRSLDATRMTGMGTRTKSGGRGILAILAAVFLLAGPVASSARAQAEPTIIGYAIDAVVQLSIIVRGDVDG